MRGTTVLRRAGGLLLGMQLGCVAHGAWMEGPRRRDPAAPSPGAEEVVAQADTRHAAEMRTRFPCSPSARYVQSMADHLESRAVLHAACAAMLEAALGPGMVDAAEVRDELGEARRLGLDWQQLYREAIAHRPASWGPAPLLEDVSPERPATRGATPSRARGLS